MLHKVCDVLRFIASNDDIIELCGLNKTLAEKYIKIYKESKKESNFDPIISLASNPELVDNKYDFWSTKKGSITKKKFGAFDADKYTKFYISSRKVYIENNENPDFKSNGFDCYSYLMAYEDDIITKYEDYSDLTLLQKAALHYIEYTYEVKQLDYLKYLASYDDLINLASESIPKENQLPWLVDFAKVHYNNTGKKEIMEGVREVTDFFDAWKYIASYPITKDLFWNKEEETLNETDATLAYVKDGFKNGLHRNIFIPDVYLANYPNRIKDDIFINGKICFHKVAKIWLMNFPNESSFDVFDPTEFADQNGVKDSFDSFKSFVNKQVSVYDKFLKNNKKIWYKFRNMMFCAKPQIKFGK